MAPWPISPNNATDGLITYLGSENRAVKLTRRHIVDASCGMAISAAVNRLAYPQSREPRLPDAASLQAGDFLWPKKPGEFIPYRFDSTTQGVNADRDEWLEEKQEFLGRARASGDPEQAAAAARIDKLSYNDFRSFYLRNQDPDAITPHSLGGVVSVGHVAIVQVARDGSPGVIEALWKRGVVQSTYAAWVAGRPGQIVWQGRLKGIAAGDGAKIASEAKRWLGKPYDFWNFDLNNTSGFYCSKLIWHSVMEALHVPVDGDPNPKRALWLSPKQELYSSKIERLVDPGYYASE